MIEQALAIDGLFNIGQHVGIMLVKIRDGWLLVIRLADRRILFLL
jgi:hypothetical protein